MSSKIGQHHEQPISQGAGTDDGDIKLLNDDGSTLEEVNNGILTEQEEGIGDGSINQEGVEA